MYTQIIGDKRAKEIVKYLVEEANKAGIEMPNAVKFIEQGPVAGVLLEAYEEIDGVMNRQGGVRVAYEDTNRFRDYVRSFFPNKIKVDMLNHYGIEKIKQVKGIFF